MSFSPLIEATGLSKRYGEGPGAVTALRDADLTVAPGELVAVMGPSGSGKSSLMNLIGLLDCPTGGSLRVMGEETAAATADRRALLRNRHVGFIFQSYHLMPRRSALGNVELPLLYRGLTGRKRRPLAEAALDRVGLTHRATALPAMMSGGEQQRVAIARALVSDPDIIVADEPTGALDSRTGERVLDLLGELRAEGRAVVVVTHDAAVAARGTRLVLISDGRILRDGPLPVPRQKAA
jgi:macrolide transport system ATP-binding/permease protein